MTESSLSAAAELINRRRDLCTITCNKETSSEQNNSGHQCLGQKNLRLVKPKNHDFLPLLVSRSSNSLLVSIRYYLFAHVNRHDLKSIKFLC